MSESSVVSEIVGSPAAAEPAEVTAPEINPQESKDVDLSSRFAALSKKEKLLLEQQNKMKEQESLYKKALELKESGKTNPVAILEHYGISLDDILASVLGTDAPKEPENEVEALRKEIESFKKSQTDKEEALKKQEEESYQKSIDEAINAHRKSIEGHLSQNAEKYELINLQGAQDLVWEVTEAHFEANKGEILTPEQAADKVEAYLEEQVRKAMAIKRFAKSPESHEKVSGIFEVERAESTKPKSQTLTSDFVQSAPSQITPTMDMEESKRRAAALLKWK